MDKKYTHIQNQYPDHIILWYYLGDKKYSQRIKVEWYFLIHKLSYLKHKVYIDSLMARGSYIQPRYKIIQKIEPIGDYLKIFCTYTRNEALTKIEKLNIQTYEADFDNAKRYWLDSGLQVSDKYKIGYFDIEVDDSGDGGLDIGKSKILSYAIKSSEGNVIYNSLKEIPLEKDLLTKLLEDLTSFDVISGWNSGGYDIPYIKARMNLYGLKLPYLAHIDMMLRMIHAYRFDTQIRSYALDSIAKHFLGVSKVKRSGRIIELFNTDYETFKKYNITDADLLYQLDQKAHILQMALRQSQWCNIFPIDLGVRGKGLYNMLDSLILRESHKNNIFGPTPKYSWKQLDNMSEEELEKLDFPGAIVFTPVPGRFDHIYTFDYKSLYPSMMRSSNISFETIVTENFEGEKVKNPSGVFFRKDVQGSIPKVLEYLMDKRKEYKLLKLKMIEEGKKDTPEYGTVESDEVVVKELSNSCYGILGMKASRYFGYKLADSVTLLGQYCLNTAKDFAESQGYTVVLGDTDSNGIVATENLDIEDYLKRYHQYLNKRIKDELNIDNTVIDLAFDRYMKRIIILKKKNYAGWLVNQEGRKTDYIHVRGLETVKSSSCKLVRTLQKQLLEKLLKENYSQEYYVQWMDELKEHAFDEVSADDISLHVKISKKLTEYKNVTLPVILARQKKEKDGILIMKEIEYIVTASDPTLKGIEAAEFTGEFDKIYYWNRCLFPALSRILKVVFTNIDWNEYKIKKVRKPRVKKLKRKCDEDNRPLQTFKNMV